MSSNVKNVYRRVALWLCLCLTIGLLPASSDVVSASSPTVKLIIGGKYVTGKTYKLKNNLARQLNVKTNNTFGNTTIKYTSSDKNKATVSSKGLIRAKKTGTVKISVKVTCKSRKRKRSRTVWTKIKIIANDASSSPSPTPTSQLGGAMQAVLIVNGTNAKQFPMTILDNECGRMLYNALPKTLYLTDENKNVKTGLDPDGLYYPMEEFKPKTLLAGDFMLFGNSKYELTYEDHTSGYAYTRLGRISSPAGLKEALGTGPASITIIKSSLPSNPTPTPTATPRPSASASPWPSGVPRPTGSASPWPSGVPTPTPTVRPSGSPGASTSPNPSSSVRPSGSPTPTPRPEYNGPRIMIQVPPTKISGGFNYMAKINTSSTDAMALYNMLSSDHPMVFEMTAHSIDPTDTSTVDYYYYAGAPAGLTNSQATTGVTFWPPGSLALVGNAQSGIYLRVFRERTENQGGVQETTILATIEESEIAQGSGWLKTMFNGAAVCTVQIYKA